MLPRWTAVLIGCLAISVRTVCSSDPIGHLVAISDGKLPYELFVPKAWETARPSPVLVFLHGRGESGGFDITNAQSLPLQLLSNKTFADYCPFIVIVPQCPVNCMYNNGWMDGVLEHTTKITAGVISRYGGDPHRIYLAGQSMGGNGAWKYAAQQLNFFAAVVVICGYAHPFESKVVVERLSGKNSIAVGVVHAADDSVIPVDASDSMVREFKRVGHESIRYWRFEHAPGPPMPEYADLIGHGSYEIAFRDPTLYAWLLSHSCSACGPEVTTWLPLHATHARGHTHGRLFDSHHGEP